MCNTNTNSGSIYNANSNNSWQFNLLILIILLLLILTTLIILLAHQQQQQQQNTQHKQSTQQTEHENSTAQHIATQHSTTQHNTPQHSSSFPFTLIKQIGFFWQPGDIESSGRQLASLLFLVVQTGLLAVWRLVVF